MAFIAGVGEIFCRVLEPKSDAIKLGVELPGSGRRYGLQPNARALQVGVEVATNALGFREKPYPLQKPAGVRRIAVLGDSYTLGVGVAFEDIFSKRLETILNARGSAYEVINFGVNGYNTEMELATFREAAAAFAPDVVLVAYVLNDSERTPNNGKRAQGRESDRSLRSRINGAHLWLKDISVFYRYLAPRFGEVLGWVGGRYWAGKTNEVLRDFDDDSVGWRDSRQALLDIQRAARAINAEALVVVLPLMLRFDMYPLTAVHEKIAQFCRANGIAVLDLLPRFRSESVGDLAVFLDGHPNAAAHRIFADGIAAYFVSSSR